ncbi:hypothetical protein [Methylobacterium indicum]|uniref:Uncharacterized protein n=1 Tax=Methylobacterium indicum TaxID=1775910 RepID=A0ABR5HJ70_9HYPH|nr:hypothetical protein [Methylobacterium indicum]KMO20360.1 hypothetical protein QR78_10985 [Methylobacterium indicum]KMO26677.1 hypothetical protein QR79_01135 [Methylobacterium indicum]
MVYWSHTFEDLRRLTDVRVQFEMVKAMSTTESLLYTAGQIFGSKTGTKREEQPLSSVSDMLAFAKMVNG